MDSLVQVLGSAFQLVNLNSRLSELPPLTDKHSFDFLDPANVLCGCHIIPRFTSGRRHEDGVGVSACAKDKDDWCKYYINR